VANIAGSLDGSAPVLAGGVVEGPNSVIFHGSLSGMRACPPNGVDTFRTFTGQQATYKDDVESFSTTEPAIDLTASSALAFAWQMSG